MALGGSDSALGTDQRPFRTLTRAHQAVLEALATGFRGTVRIWLRNGVHRLARPLVFAGEHFGAEGVSVHIASFPGEEAAIVGSAALRDWSRRGRWWVCPVPREWRPRFLFWKRARYAETLRSGERRLRRARCRSEQGGDAMLEIGDCELGYKGSSLRLRIDPRAIAGWHIPRDTEIVVYRQWAVTQKRVSRLEPTTGDFWLAGPHVRVGSPNAIPVAGHHCYLQSLHAAPRGVGEWALTADKEAILVNLGEDEPAPSAEAPLLESLIELRGTPGRPVRNVHFSRIRFAHTAWHLPHDGYHGMQAGFYRRFRAGYPLGRLGLPSAAIELRHAENCSLDDCRIEDTGGCAIALGTGCRRNRIERNRLVDIGSTGIVVGDWERDSAPVIDNSIRGNRIERCGELIPGSVGIWVGFAQGTQIVGNRISHLPYSGISIGWSWGPEVTSCRENLVEENVIHDVMRLLSDGGGIYTLGYQPGTRFVRNRIYDVRWNPKAGMPAGNNNGFFIDEGSKGFAFEDNHVHCTAGPAVRFHRSSQRAHSWTNNTFAACRSDPAGASGECPAARTPLASPESPHD